MHGLRESIKNICSKYGIQTYFKGNRTVQNILVSLKDKDPMEETVELFTGTDARDWIVMVSTKEIQLEYFEKDSKKT